MSDKEIKLDFKKLAQANPEKHYPVQALKSYGYQRKQCTNCKTYFWTKDAGRKICGDNACAGGFHFIGNSPAKKKLDYIQTWQEFARIHKKLGYTPIERYPVVARWNPTTDFTIASIAAFQPMVVSGEIKPPANPLVIPQFCVRFNDIDNVGITGAHYAGFVMLGQHAFVAPKDYNINKYFTDHVTWLEQGLGLSTDHITVHEDAWAGGGNLGPSVEFHSAGLELSNQVYMQYDVKSGKPKELNIKVLDMGQGHERVPWFTQGQETSYETTFPSVVKKLRSITNIKSDKDLMKKFLPYAAWLNIDEVASVDEAWKRVAGKVGMPVASLKPHIQQQAALYSIAEHSRALLFTINDGQLPSNVGGGYNLRVLFRRAMDFIAAYKWDVDMADLCKLHAAYLKPIFPELSLHLDEVKEILDVEAEKYQATRQKAHSMVERIVKKDVTSDVLLQLYDSQGISPELVREEAAKQNITINVPENFYAQVAALHEKKAQVHETKKEMVIVIPHSTPETKALYFDDWKAPTFKAKIVHVVDKHVILDQTYFYPTSGGQLSDKGTIGAYAVVDVFKQGPWIVHTLDGKMKLAVGSPVEGHIDMERRQQLAQHHTATHIINAAARHALGNHVNQASARKTLEKGSIDITHYSRLTEKQLIAIEKEANDIVKNGLSIKKSFIPREDAERKHGMRIYQGGVAPGKLLRIVDIQGVDVEACGGTHLNSTKEAELIRIISSAKIADDVVRIEYVAGAAAHAWDKASELRSIEIAELVKKMLNLSVKVTPHSLQAAADVFSVTVEQLHSTLKKFIQQIKENESLFQQLGEIHTHKLVKTTTLEKLAEDIFGCWKEQKKELEKIQEKRAAEQVQNIKENSVVQMDADAQVLRDIAATFKNVLLLKSDGMFVFKGSDKKFEELVKLGAKGGGKDLRQGRVDNVQKVLKNFKF